MTLDAPIVESSPTLVVDQAEAAPEQTEANQPEPLKIEEFTKEQREQWLKDGEIPTKAKSAETPTATDATKGKADTETESAPVNPKTEKRFQEILKDRNAARKEAAELKAKLEAATRLPETQATAPVKPNAADFESWDLYEAAIDKYTEEVSEYKANQKIAAKETQSKQQTEEQQIAEQWNKREAKFKESNPDFDTELAAAEISSHPNGSIIAGLIVRDPNGPAIANYLMENPEALKRIGNAAQIEAVREITKIGLTFEVSTKTDEATGKAKLESTSKPISKSGPPAHEIATNSAPVDELEEALKSKDFERYKKIMDRRDKS
jgi:hypothetical protein